MNKLIITEKGIELMTKLIEGTSSVRFTRVCSSTHDYSENDIFKLVDLEDIRQTAKISAIGKISSDTVQIAVHFSSNNLEKGYFIHTIGLFAVDPEGNEILYGAATESGHPDYMPEFNEKMPAGIDYTFNIVIGNADSVIIKSDPEATVTRIELDELGFWKMDKLNPEGIGTFSMGRVIGSVTGTYSSVCGYAGEASGIVSHAEGSRNIASGAHAHAEGTDTVASGANSHSQGSHTKASGSGSHAAGMMTEAIGHNSHASGLRTIARRNCETVVGKYNLDYETPEGEVEDPDKALLFAVGNGTAEDERSNAFEVREDGGARVSGMLQIDNELTVGNRKSESTVGSNSIVLGVNCEASGKYSYAEGEETAAKGNFAAHAEGKNTTAEGDFSHAEGYKTTASGNGAHAEGSYFIDITDSNGNIIYNKALGWGSHVEGCNNISSANAAHAEGCTTIASGKNSHAEGARTTTSENAAHAEGNRTTASGDGAHAEGSYFNNITDSSGNIIYNEASGRGSHVEGCNNISSANAAHAEGCTTKASNDQAHAEGFGTIASGNNSHAEGHKTIASRIGAHAEGSYFTNITDSSGNVIYNEASGRGSHVEGCNSTSSADAAHAEGLGTIASGRYSHAEGQKTIASATGAHAEGANTIADGLYAHAAGVSCNAKGDHSFCHGQYNIANFKQFVIGYYNTELGTQGSSGNQAFIIGSGHSSPSGTGDRSDATLQNCFRIEYSGNVYSNGVYNSSGADYAEYIKPWADGNPEREDRVGYFVTIQNGMLCKANSSDYIVGITSGNPSVIGNGDEEWRGRWKRDEFNRLITEEVEVNDFEEEFDEKTGKTEMKKIGSHKEIRPVQVENYDANKKYIERKLRPEWDCVGMIGVLPLRDDGTCVAGGFAKCGENGIATAAEAWECHKTFFVIERINDKIISVEMR